MLYEINIKDVRVNTEQEAEQLAKSFQIIANTLTVQEVIDLAKLLKEKPGIVKKAKQFRNFL